MSAHRYFIEGSNGDSLFVESVTAATPEEATIKGIRRLCEAWYLDISDIKDLNALGYAVSVRPYLPSDYVRAAALDMYDAIRAALPELDHLLDCLDTWGKGGSVPRAVLAERITALRDVRAKAEGFAR